MPKTLDLIVHKVKEQYIKRGYSPKRAENTAWAVAQRIYREKRKNK